MMPEMPKMLDLGDKGQVVVVPDADTLASAAATQLLLAGDRSVFTVALSGGSTPKRMFQVLADENLPFRGTVRWSNIHFFWGDERHVPADHADSNYRMTRENLLDRVPIPPENVHRIPTEHDPADDAATYQAELTSFFAAHGKLFAGVPRFDLVYLGMGPDGHTASLFPGTPAVHEQTKFVVANFVPKFDSWRITFTPPLINAAAQVMFLVGGADKASRLKEVLTGPTNVDELPSQVVRPADGRLLWAVDKAAAAELPEA